MRIHSAFAMIGKHRGKLTKHTTWYEGEPYKLNVMQGLDMLPCVKNSVLPSHRDAK